MPSARAAAVVRSMNLAEVDDARRNRERLAQAKPSLRSQQGKRQAKVTLALVAPAARLHRADEDATPERLAQAKAGGETIGKMGVARHFASPFAFMARRGNLHAGGTRAAIALNDALFSAGLKYAEAYEGAHIGALRSAGAGPAVARTTAPTINHGERAVSCRKRVDQAREAIGLRMVGLVEAVVIDGKSLETLADVYGTSSNHRLRQIETRVMLVEALHRLVERWGMFDYKALGEAA